MQDYAANKQVVTSKFRTVAVSSADLAALEFAVITGDSTTVQSLLSAWQEQLISDETTHALKGFLVDAIKARDSCIVELLLAKNSPFDLSHVQLAIEMGSTSILQCFLEHGWKINECVDWVTPPTLRQVTHVEVVKQVLTRSSFALGDENLTQWFLDHGADPNIRPEIDCTALSMAVLRAPKHIIELLIDRGGEVSHGQLIQYAACRKGDDRLKVLELLLSCDAPGLDEIMYHNSPESFDMFRDFGLGTPLHLASENGHIDVVQYLLARGVSTTTRDSCGRTPLDCAQRNGHIGIVELLEPFSVACDEANLIANPVCT
jgi:ankyrin repeat protein